MTTTTKYQIKDESGQDVASFSNLKDMQAFWNGPVGRNLTIVEEFGRKGHHIVYIVRVMK
jgi:hypothetical protein